MRRTVAFLVLLLSITAAAARPSLSLDGNWSLTLDPLDPATKRMVTAGLKTSGPIAVPGAWQAQGFGEDTATMHHQYMGAATYTREIEVGPTLLGPDRRLFLVAQRVQRAAKLFVATNNLVATHTGYLSIMEADISRYCPSSTKSHGIFG